MYSATAAIDLLLRYYQICQRGDRLAVEKELGGLAAAYTIVWTSVMYTVLLIFKAITVARLEEVARQRAGMEIARKEDKMRYEESSEEGDEVSIEEKIFIRTPRSPRARAIPKEWRYMTIGLLPALTAMIIFGSATQIQENIFTKDILEQFPAHLYVRNGQRLDFSTWAFTFDWIVMGIFSTGFIFFYPIANFLQTETTPGSAPGKICVSFFRIGCVFALFVLFPIWSYIFLSLGVFMDSASAIVRSDTYTSELCPFTHYSLFDLDQTFALLLGIVCFVAEFRQGFIWVFESMCWAPAHWMGGVRRWLIGKGN